ncbi:DUF4214 domain-containing protein [Stutzerimonas stutzeri]|uniref:DUF4214 domain-containing protein n=1 Tax=Stutzerimonas stutzeri TaxID=316 RepID=UPI000ED60BF4|nr:DUF4214 domain-containing protein [Stutzerimonas stutzeri]RRV40457.1 DUF4214 domain-containing protein [Stutzerimonas stutzeri]HBZ99394.1 hypothetical protein [Pseudomonas sp.]
MSATISKAITAVYVGMYNRAADQAGYQWWLAQFGGNPDAAISDSQMKQLSQGFANISYFQSAYPASLSDVDFINKLYMNIGGNAGDAAGIEYWQSRLEALEGNRADMVGEFLYGFVSIDLSSQGSLSDYDYQQAKQRQDSLLNKVSVGETFRDLLGEQTNLVETDPSKFDTDPAFILSREIIAAVDHTASSTAEAVQAINDRVPALPPTPPSEQPAPGPGGDYVNGYDQLFSTPGPDVHELLPDDSEFLIVGFDVEHDRFAMADELRAQIGTFKYTGEVDRYEDLASADYFTGVAGQAAIVRQTGKVFMGEDGMLSGSPQLIIDVDGSGSYNAADIAINMPGVYQLEDFNFL